jgi:hypothetical protein
MKGILNPLGWRSCYSIKNPLKGRVASNLELMNGILNPPAGWCSFYSIKNPLTAALATI